MYRRVTTKFDVEGVAESVLQDVFHWPAVRSASGFRPVLMSPASPALPVVTMLLGEPAGYAASIACKVATHVLSAVPEPVDEVEEACGDALIEMEARTC